MASSEAVMSTKRALSSPVFDGKILRGAVHKVVLTGGPCGGKTTSSARIRTFFESLGWKVFSVPETATILLGGGVKFSDLSQAQADTFQGNVLETILQLEKVYFDLAEQDEENVIVVCDRGAMDPSAFIGREEWLKILQNLDVSEIDLRDNRYNQVIHLVTAASGAEPFYSLDNNATRSEPLEMARANDKQAMKAWVGHPYYDVIDNSTDFETKIRRVIQVIAERLSRRLGVDVVSTDDRLSSKSKKRKFLVRSMPPIHVFPEPCEFEVRHDYLLSSDTETQARLRKRGNGMNYMYTHTIRKRIEDEVAEARMQLSSREYDLLMAQRDNMRDPIHKLRHCFLWKGTYFQLDVYTDKCPQRCRGLKLIETFTAKAGDQLELPNFLDIEKEVTGDPSYSMYWLALKDTTDGANGAQDGDTQLVNGDAQLNNGDDEVPASKRVK